MPRPAWQLKLTGPGLPLTDVAHFLLLLDALGRRTLSLSDEQGCALQAEDADEVDVMVRLAALQWVQASGAEPLATALRPAVPFVHLVPAPGGSGGAAELTLRRDEHRVILEAVARRLGATVTPGAIEISTNSLRAEVDKLRR